MNINNLKQIDMKNMLFKGLFALLLLAGTTALAQTTNGGDNVAQGDAAGVSVKLIDNKGTIKYLQSNNGITTITSTEADNKTTTTWQLGGTLVDNTYIESTGKAFSLDGLKLVDGTTTAAAGTATDQSIGSNATTIKGSGTAASETGWTLLIRDESTGEIKKMLATDLVSGIRVEHTQSADASADVDITVTGLPALTTGTTIAKLFVYRNGAKLRTGTDFVAAADKVTITYNATNLPMYKDDVVEIQYIK